MLSCLGGYTEKKEENQPESHRHPSRDFKLIEIVERIVFQVNSCKQFNLRPVAMKELPPWP
jgi:hypothetical protein